jgi:hypothetical protein
MTTRNYSNTATAGSLTAPVSPSDVILAVASFSNLPSAPFTATVDRGLSSEESVLVTAVNSGNVTVTRGYNGTASQTHWPVRRSSTLPWPWISLRRTRM